MVLSIACKQFAFERAQARIIPVDWGDPSSLARGDPAALFESIDVVDDRIASVTVPAPGEFLLLLTELMVRRFHDNRRFQVVPFFARFNLTDADVMQGSARVILNPVGVFRVSIFDRGHEPLRGRELVLSRDNMTISFLTDADGGVLFLGNPTHGNPTQFGIATGTATITIASL